MKATGIVRHVDALGRVVLPMELRKSWNIDEGCALEIFTDDDKIIFKKYEPACIFNGTADDLIEYNGRKVSRKAVREMAELIGMS